MGCCRLGVVCDKAKGDATVCGAACLGVVVSKRLGFAKAFGGDPGDQNAAGQKTRKYSVCPLLAEREVHFVAALAVGVTFDHKACVWAFA